MIDLYYWPTPNGRKISIMLEECGLDYNVVRCDIGAGDQFDPAFLKISPNNRMPAVVDQDTGISVFEGGAILIYLAEKAGQLLPAETAARFGPFWTQGSGWVSRRKGEPSSAAFGCSTDSVGGRKPCFMA